MKIFKKIILKYKNFHWNWIFQITLFTIAYLLQIIRTTLGLTLYKNLYSNKKLVPHNPCVSQTNHTNNVNLGTNFAIKTFKMFTMNNVKALHWLIEHMCRRFWYLSLKIGGRCYGHVYMFWSQSLSPTLMKLSALWVCHLATVTTGYQN